MMSRPLRNAEVKSVPWYCASTIIILSATAGVLGWFVLHLREAMSAQKEALEATKATVEALKTQSDLKVEPMKETISSKDAAIQALEAQLSAAVERKALAEGKLSASQQHLNQSALFVTCRNSPHDTGRSRGGKKAHYANGGDHVLQLRILSR